MPPAKPLVVIVGSGLAGCSAALQLREIMSGCRCAEVLVLEKEGRAGGNSHKASSGISILSPEHGDTEEHFVQDCLDSGRGLCVPLLVQTLVRNSRSALEFLQSFGCDLSASSQLGGHSHRRTHCPPGAPVGWHVMSKLLDSIKAESDSSVQITLRTGATVIELERKEGGKMAVTYTVAGEGAADGESVTVLADAVVLATGGFGANKDLLRKHSPEAASYATTNGPWATGDGLLLGAAVSAGTRLMDQVQLHPTGLVDPKDPGAGTKFLGPEKLRGVGGILLNAAGQRFVNELERRDTVTAAIISQQGESATLLLPEAGAQDYGAKAVDFYCSKGFATKVENLEEAARALGVPAEVLRKEAEAVNEAFSAGAPCPLGRTHFAHPCNPDAPFYFMKVAPVVHYTMGGLAFDASAQVLADDGCPIPGLWCAGEVSGGTHGKNRLAGCSLAECVVFGRVAAESIAKQLLTSR
mmetsp:Transcript_37791/g.96735  ORF Transcript_37791/g.96735 Transcript_37791/m.96735 type:complete len:469 (+) Transcript_37791:242-1648(+)|eukprot:jgi/Tetstr1/425251/TSEL_015705.t2